MRTLQAEAGEQWLPEYKSSSQITAEMGRLNLTSLAPIKIQVMSVKMSKKKVTKGVTMRRERDFLRGISKKLQLKLLWAFQQQSSLGGKQFSRLLATKSHYRDTSKVVIRQISCIFFLPCPAVIGLKQETVTMQDLHTGRQVFPQRTAEPIGNTLSQVSNLDFFFFLEALHLYKNHQESVLKLLLRLRAVGESSEVQHNKSCIASAQSPKTT